MKGGSSNEVTDVSSNITAVQKSNKDNVNVVNVASIFTDKQPIYKVKRYCHHDKRRVDIEQLKIMSQSKTSMSELMAWIKICRRI